MDIPKGRPHLRLLTQTALRTHALSSAFPADQARDMIGTALCVFYEAATCNRKCQGGGHMLERLCGRIYNLGDAAYLLICSGLYDEALNLIRSVGETGNLIALSVVDKAAIREWLESDKKTRMKKFSPAKVRKALAKHGANFLIADDDWYARFCEEYTHVTPDTHPNRHNPANLSTVGGVPQEVGCVKALEELATALGMTAQFICGYFGFTDLMHEMQKIVGNE